MKVVYLSQSDVERGRLVEVRGRLVSLFLLHLYLAHLLLLQSWRNSLTAPFKIHKIAWTDPLKKNRNLKSDSSESQTEKAERLKEWETDEEKNSYWKQKTEREMNSFTTCCCSLCCAYTFWSCSMAARLAASSSSCCCCFVRTFSIICWPDIKINV